VFLSAGTALTAYDDQTGAQRWTTTGTDVLGTLQLAGGRPGGRHCGDGLRPGAMYVAGPVQV